MSGDHNMHQKPRSFVDADDTSQKHVDEMVKTEHNKQIEIAKAYERGWNAALAQQEPVAWITDGGKGELWWHQSSKFDEEGNLIGPNPDDIPLYTAPRDSDNTAQRTVDKIKGREMTTMDDAIAAGDGVLMNEQAALLRECRMALDHLLRDKPMLAAKVCGTTTLGNLRAMLHEYRPQGVFGGMK